MRLSIKQFVLRLAFRQTILMMRSPAKHVIHKKTGLPIRSKIYRDAE